MRRMQADKKLITVGITTPGWPVSSYPNGIVTYVNNIILGFSAHVKPVILAAPLTGSEIDQALVDLSSVRVKKNIALKLIDALLFNLNLKLTHSIQYKKTALVFAKKIILAIETLNPPIDIIEVEESFGTPDFLIKMTEVPVVVRIHGPWFLIGPILQAENQWDFKLRLFYEGQAIKNANGITSPSLDVLKKTREYYGLELPNAKVIPNPVIEVSVDKQWQYSMNLKPIKSSILFVGRFDSVKGGDLVLQAFQVIALKNKDVELLFVGPDRGVTISGEEINFNGYIERFIHENAIKNRIQFLGHCDQKRIADLRKNALVTVVCSRYETFSISLVESLAAGCPTVATAVGGMKEIIIDDFNGLLAEPESAQSIAEKVLSLIADPEKMQRLSKNAIEDCKRRFSPEVVAAQTLEYYESVLARVSETSTNMKKN